MRRRLLFGYRLDAVEWAVLLIVCVAVTVTLASMSYEGPGVVFGGIPFGLGAVTLLRRFRPSLVHQPGTSEAEGKLVSLLLFAVGSLLVVVTLMFALFAFGSSKLGATFAAVSVFSALLAAASFYGGVRLRRPRAPAPSVRAPSVPSARRVSTPSPPAVPTVSAAPHPSASMPYRAGADRAEPEAQEAPFFPSPPPRPDADEHG